MADSTSPDSPLEAAAGVAGPHTVEAFELLGNETRLAILLALWEAYTPYAENNTISFSELRERVGVRDSGQFNYHLGKLVGHYVEETDKGYELRGAGQNIVQTVIAGTGLTQETLSPTELQIACTLCGAPTEISYDDGFLYFACTECEGYFGDEFADDFPAGTSAVWGLNPAGLANRSPEEIFAAGHISTAISLSAYNRGVCPTCLGVIDESVQLCDSHVAEQGELCPNCGTRDEVRVRWVCSVCKQAGAFPVSAAVYDNPDVLAFYNEQGVDFPEHVEDPESCARVIEYTRKRDHEIESKDPLRIRVMMPGKDASLHLTLNEDLKIIDSKVEDREKV